MVTLIECQICDGPYSMMREHCPYCGARRIFSGSDSAVRHTIRVREPETVFSWNHGSFTFPEQTREIVRAVRSNLAFNFIQR